MKKQFPILPLYHNYSIRRYLRTHFPHLSQDNIHKSLRNGDIRINGTKIDIDFVLQQGDILYIWDALISSNIDISCNNTKLFSQAYEYAFLKPLLIAQRKDIWCFNKPSGLAVQGGTGLHTNMNYLLSGMMYTFNIDYKPHIVHRLDKGTSGCCLFATNTIYASAIAVLFENRAIKKHYIAICQYIPGEEDLLNIKPYGTISDNIDDQESITEYKLEYVFTIDAIINNYTKQTEKITLALVSFFPKTGRKHQIRKHAASLNWPILGDSIYNPLHDIENASISYPQLCLHAKAISYTPTKQTIAAIARVNAIVNIEAFHYNADIPIHITKLLPTNE